MMYCHDTAICIFSNSNIFFIYNFVICIAIGYALCFYFPFFQVNKMNLQLNNICGGDF